MGKTKCCCNADAGCCDGACADVINRIEIEIANPAGGSPWLYTMPIGRAITEKCYESKGFGDHCTQTVPTNGGGVPPCASMISGRYDYKITITHYTTPLPPRFELYCPIQALDVGTGRIDISGQGANSSYSSTSNSHIYYWSDTADIQTTSFTLSSLIFATYQGTGFNLPLGNGCNTDSQLAVYIKTQLASALSAYPEFAPANFDVAIERHHITCDAPLGFFSQRAYTYAICSPQCRAEQYLDSVMDGFFVQVGRELIVINFMSKLTVTLSYYPLSYGASCPAGETAYRTSVKRIQITEDGCFLPEYTIPLTFESYSAGTIFGCTTSTPPSYDAYEISTTMTVRVYYD